MNLRGLYYPIYQDDVRHLSIDVQQRFTHPGLPNGSSMEHTTAVAQVPAGLAPQSDHPKIVGLDEFAWRRDHRYGTIVCDLEQHRIDNLLAVREIGTITAWLKNRPGRFISRHPHTRAVLGSKLTKGALAAAFSGQRRDDYLSVSRDKSERFAH